MRGDINWTSLDEQRSVLGVHVERFRLRPQLHELKLKPKYVQVYFSPIRIKWAGPLVRNERVWALGSGVTPF